MDWLPTPSPGELVPMPGKKPKPLAYSVAAEYALAPMENAGYTQWVGMVLTSPDHVGGMVGVMTTGGMWARVGDVDACLQVLSSMLKAEMAPNQYVQVFSAEKELHHLRQWMINQWPYLSMATGNGTQTDKTVLTLPPSIQVVSDVQIVQKLIGQMGITATTAMYVPPPPSTFPAPQTFSVGGLALSDSWGKEFTAKWAGNVGYTPQAPALIVTELVPDVACSANGCAHRLTSHVQNKPGESGPCVIPGCTCEQWRSFCSECSRCSYPWHFVHTTACKSGQRIRQVLADRAELEQNEKRNRRARTSIEQIPEDF